MQKCSRLETLKVSLRFRQTKPGIVRLQRRPRDMDDIKTSPLLIPLSSNSLYGMYTQAWTESPMSHNNHGVAEGRVCKSSTPQVVHTTRHCKTLQKHAGMAHVRESEVSLQLTP